MSRWAMPLIAAAIAALIELGLLSRELPGVLTAVAMALWVVSVVTIGYTGRWHPGLAVAALLAVVPVIVTAVIGPASPDPPPGGCDPSCGLSDASVLVLIAPIAAGLAVAGALWRGIATRTTSRQPVRSAPRSRRS